VSRLDHTVEVMTTTVLASPARTRLVSGALLLRFVSLAGSAIGFYLPLSVVPLYAAQAGAGSLAGLATVALLLATVGCELVTPRLIGRIGYRWALSLGLVLLGAPTIVLTLTGSAAAIVAVSVVRGAGFAISVVAGSAATAALIPADRRGEGLALIGVVSGVCSLLALPAGVWVAAHWGYPPVFVATAVAPLLALLSVPGLPRRAPAGEAGGHHGVLAGLRKAALMRPATVFAASTAAAGVFVTFLPLALTGRSTSVTAAALLVQPAAATIARWVSGRLGDRHGSARLLAPGVLLTAAGIAALAATATPAAVLGGALAFGAGFGLLQNATLALMYARVPTAGHGAVSAIWNAAYDLGMAAGALGAGLLIGSIGYSATFVATAAVILLALVLVRSDRRA
jgi:predicted MFS family arabinose efflux permease